ncbi:MAG: hypothetical protein M0011_00685 [Elusimicrobia bacterium]|nr:hypothetical protein [Elusimicrobiota bacterium]
MKKIALAGALCLAAGGLRAADFSLDSAKLADIPAVSVPGSAPQLPAPKPVRNGHYVQVSGYVNLNGNGWMPAGDNGGFTSVTLNGWATFRDATGKVTSNNTYISTSVSLWVRPNQYVFQTVWPNVYATFYRDGKMVGSTSMSGSVSVNGWPSSSFFSLSGSGYLNGSVYVEDERK